MLEQLLILHLSKTDWKRKMSFSQLAIQRALTEIPILPNGCAAISPVGFPSFFVNYLINVELVINDFRDHQGENLEKSSVMRVKTMNTSEWFIFFVSALLTVTTILNYYAISYFTSINKNFGRDMPYRREQINSIIVVPPTAAVCALLTMLAPRLISERNKNSISIFKLNSFISRKKAQYLPRLCSRSCLWYVNRTV